MAFKTNNYDDRFIPQRSSLDVKRAPHSVFLEAEHRLDSLDIFAQTNRVQRKRAYMHLLWSTLSSEHPGGQTQQRQNVQPRVLCYGAPNSRYRGKLLEEITDSVWPVHARTKPLIKKPIAVLDLPSFNGHFVKNIVDWSKSGHIASILNGNVILWKKSRQQMDIVVKTKIQAHHALKFDYSGTRLAVSTKEVTLAIWTLTPQKMTHEICHFCVCPLLTCRVTVIAWDKRDRHLVTGCSGGNLVQWSAAGLRRLAYRLGRPGSRAVVALQFSAGNVTLATSWLDGAVRVWQWPHFQCTFEVKFQSPTKAIAFHPWQDDLLAIGGGVGCGCISIWNVNGRSQVARLTPPDNSHVDSLAWNPITGELVSCHQICKNGVSSTRVLVLASLKKVVDNIAMPSARVLYMMWNPDGTQLAMVGSNESLYVWNFFGDKSQSICKKVMNEKGHNRTVSYLRRLEYCIR